LKLFLLLFESLLINLLFPFLYYKTCFCFVLVLGVDKLF